MVFSFNSVYVNAGQCNNCTTFDIRFTLYDSSGSQVTTFTNSSLFIEDDAPSCSDNSLDNYTGTWPGIYDNSNYCDMEGWWNVSLRSLVGDCERRANTGGSIICDSLPADYEYSSQFQAYEVGWDNKTGWCTCHGDSWFTGYSGSDPEAPCCGDDTGENWCFGQGNNTHCLNGVTYTDGADEDEESCECWLNGNIANDLCSAASEGQSCYSRSATISDSYAPCCGDDGATDDWCFGSNDNEYCLNGGYYNRNVNSDERSCLCYLNDDFTLDSDDCDSNGESDCWDGTGCCEGGTDEWCDGTDGACVQGTWWNNDNSNQETCNCVDGESYSRQTCQNLGSGTSDCWDSEASGGSGLCCRLSNDDFCDGGGDNSYCLSGTWYDLQPDSDESACLCSLNNNYGSSDDCDSDGEECWDSSADSGNGECCGDGTSDNWCSGSGYQGCLNGVFRTDGDYDSNICDCGGSGSGPCDVANEDGCWNSGGTGQNKCCGDDAGSDNFCVGSGACHSGVYRTEADDYSTVCNCTVGQDLWNNTSNPPEYESGTPSCCGDDPSENKIEQTCGGDDCSTWPSYWACCSDANDCSYRNQTTTEVQCFDYDTFHDPDEDGENEICINGAWEDGDYPKYSSVEETPSGPITYSYLDSYQFNITWNDTTNVDTVFLEHNFTGSSTPHNDEPPYVVVDASGHQKEYYFDVSGLAAGNYVYRWIANDTLDNWNNSFSQVVYTVSKDTPSINLYIDGVSSNKVINWTVTSGIKANETNWIDTDLTYNLYRNNGLVDSNSADSEYTEITDSTQLSNDTYVFVYNTSGGENWTSQTTSLTLKVHKLWNQTDSVLAGSLYKPDLDELESPIAKDVKTRIQDDSFVTVAGGSAYSVIPIEITNNATDIGSIIPTTFTNIDVSIPTPSGWTGDRTNWVVGSLADTEANETNATFHNDTGIITKSEDSWIADNSTEQNITYQKILKRLYGDNNDNVVSYDNVNYTTTCKSGYACNTTTGLISVSSSSPWEVWIGAENSSQIITTTRASKYQAPEYYQNITIDETDAQVTFFNLTGWSTGFDDSNVTSEYIRYWDGDSWYSLSTGPLRGDCNTGSPTYTATTGTPNGTFYVCMQDTGGKGGVGDYWKFKVPHTSEWIIQVGGTSLTPPRWSALQYDSNVDVNDSSTVIRINVTDDVQVDKVWIRENSSGSFANYTMNLEDGDDTDGLYNHTMTFNSIGNVGFEIFMNDTSDNINSTSSYLEVQDISITEDFDQNVNPSDTVYVYGNVKTIPDNNDVSEDVYIYRDGTQVSQCTPSSGFYNCSIAAPATLGAYTIKVNVTDSNGIYNSNQSTLYVETLTVDELNVNYVTNSYYNYSQEINITGHVKNDRTGSDSLANVTWYVPNSLYSGTAESDSSGNFEVTFNNDLCPDTWTFRINQSDVNDTGNVFNDEQNETTFDVYNRILVEPVYSPSSGGIVDRHTGGAHDSEIFWNMTNIQLDCGDSVVPDSVEIDWKSTNQYMGSETNGSFDVPNNTALAAGNDYIYATVYKSGFYHNYTNTTNDYEVYGVLDKSSSLYSISPSGTVIVNWSPAPFDPGPTIILQSVTIYNKQGVELTENQHYTSGLSVSSAVAYNAADNLTTEVIIVGNSSSCNSINCYTGDFNFTKWYMVHGKFDSVWVDWNVTGGKIDRFSPSIYGGPEVGYSDYNATDNKGILIPQSNYSIEQHDDWDASDNAPGDVITPELRFVSCSGSSCYWDNIEVPSKPNTTSYTVYGNLTKVKLILPQNETEIYTCCIEPRDRTLVANLTNDTGGLHKGASMTFHMTDGSFQGSDEGNGTYTYVYDPIDTLQVGMHEWKAEANQTYYHDSGNSSSLYIWIRGVFINSTTHIENSSITRGTDNYLEARLTDENGQGIDEAGYECEWYIDSTNIGNTTTNSSGYCNITWNPDYNSITVGRHNLTVRRSVKEEVTPVNVFGWSEVKEISPPNRTEVLLGQNVPITCRVGDYNDSSDLSDYRVYFYQKPEGGSYSSFGGAKYTNSSGIAMANWDTGLDTAGVYYFKCNISESYVDESNGIFYNRSHEFENTTNITSKASLWISDTIVDNMTVYRDDGYATGKGYSYRVNLTAQAKQGTNPSNGAEIHFYTPDGIMNCTTGASGYCSYIYNPSGGVFPYNYTVPVNATKAPWQPTTNFDIELEIRGVIWLDNYTISPQDIGVNYDSTEISTDVFTDLAVDEVWAVIGLPGGSSENISLNPQTGYWAVNYTPSSSGLHNVTLYVNDTSDFGNTSFAGYFKAWASTTGRLSQEPQDNQFRTTQTDGADFILNLTLYNTGNGTMMDADAYNQSNPSWPMANITSWKNQEISVNSSHTSRWNVSIPAATTPGDYIITGIGNWSNPDYSLDSETNTTTVTILENPIMNMTYETYSKRMNHSTEEYIGNFLFNSTGNFHLDEIYYNNVSGNISNDWIEFTSGGSTNYIGSISPGSYANVTINATVPQCLPPGIYRSTFVVNATNSTQFCVSPEDSWGYLNITLNISEDWTWNRVPNSFAGGDVNTSGAETIGYINVTNSGNLNITFDLTKHGNISSLLAMPSSFVVEGNYSVYNLPLNYSIPADQSVGFYEGFVSISNSSADPDYPQNTTVNFTVWDNLEPLIANASISKDEVQANIEYLNISADVVDNTDDTDKVWAIIENTYYNYNNTIELYNIAGNNYSRGYTATQGGEHEVTIYANDTSGNTNQTYAGNFSCIGQVTVSNNQLPQQVTADNISSDNPYNFTINVTLNNTQAGTVSDVNLTLVSIPSGYNINATNYTCGDLNQGDLCYREFEVSVTKDASPNTGFDDEIIINSTWINPDFSEGAKFNLTKVHVESNRELTLDKNYIENDLNHSVSEIAGNFTVYASGNGNIYGVQISESGGNLPSAWISYNPSSNLGNVDKDSPQLVEVYLDIPSGQDPGVYWTNVTVNATLTSCSPSDECWEFLILNITVPEDKSWDSYPEGNPGIYELNLSIPSQTSGTYNITLNNTGNVDRNWTITSNWNGAEGPANIDNYPEWQNVSKVSSEIITFDYDATGTSEGLYVLDLTFSNNTAIPTSRIVTVNMNVSDEHPKIYNQSVSPSYVDMNYETVNIYADLTDNVELDMSWYNVTKPDNSKERVFVDTNINWNESTMDETYTPNQSGSYQIKICVNDSASRVNCTDSLSFTSVGTTSIDLLKRISGSEITSPVVVNGITQTNGENFWVNITLNNTGQGGAYWPNLTISLPSGWSTNPASPRIYDNITEGENNTEQIRINIPSGTGSGIYDVDLTAQWTQPNNNRGQRVEDEEQGIQVNVTTNPILKIEESSLSINTAPELSNQTYFTLNSTGNDDINNIDFECMGSTCSEIFDGFTPNSLSQLVAGNETNVTVDISVPSGFSPGSYELLLNASGDEDMDDINLTVTVAVDWRWNRTPTSFSRTVETNSTPNYLGDIEIENMGNIPIKFGLSKHGNVSDQIILNVSEITVGSLSTGAVKVQYNTSYVNEDFYGVISVTNSSASPAEFNTSVTLNVVELVTDILYPNQTSRMIGVVANDTIESHANVTYDEDLIDENVTWEIKLDNYDCLNVSWNYDGYWNVTCVAPDIPDAHNYTLQLIGNYTTMPGGTWGETSDSEAGVINYLDVTPPKFKNFTAPSVQVSQQVNVQANISDNTNVENATLEIEHPNGTKKNYTMTYTGSLWEFNFSETQKKGDYDYNLYANDNEQNKNYTVGGWFEVYQELVLSCGVKNSTGSGIESRLKFYRNDAPKTNNYKIHDFSAPSGSLSQNVHNRTYDISVEMVKGSVNDSVTFDDTAIEHTSVKNITKDEISSDYINLEDVEYELRGIGLNTTFEFSRATVCINYDGFTYDSQDDIRIYKCNDWDFDSKTCNSSSWTELNTTVDKNSHIACSNTTSFSGFFAAQKSDCSYAGGSCSVDGDCCSGFRCCGGQCHVIADCPYCCEDVCSMTECESSGDGPGGGSGTGTGTGTGTNETAAECGNGVCEIGENYQNCPSDCPSDKKQLQFSKDLIEITLSPGEYQAYPLGVTNNLNEDILAELEVEGKIWEFSMFSETSLNISAGMTGFTDVKFYTLSSTPLGTYTGNIVVRYEDYMNKIPVKLNVIKKEKSMLDINAETIVPKLFESRVPTFKIDVYVLGEANEVEVLINYTIEKSEVRKLVLKEGEKVSVDRKLTYTKSFNLPEEMEEGRYLLEIEGSYKNNTASAITSFEIGSKPLVFTIFYNIATSLWTYVVVIIVVFGYLGFRYYKKYKKKKRAESKYPFPLDFGKLPLGVKIGKVAETKVSARWDLNKLTQHMIVAGGTGSGKTVGAMVMAEEALKKGIPVIVFDPTAQWTGFVRPCRDDDMLKLYDGFGIKREEATAFKGNIIDVTDPSMDIDVKNYANKGEITVFSLSKMTPSQLDSFVVKTVNSIFKIPWEESRKLKLLIVYDEVHRLLPKYGGKDGYKALERGVREFRKWGIGLIMLSQVISDFRETVRAVISSEAQLRTKYSKDIERVEKKYGERFAKTLPKLEIGTALVQNPEFNKGDPWFVRFRPLLHDTSRISESELQKYKEFENRISRMEKEVEELKKKKINTYDVELELKLAKEKVKQTQFRMAETYIQSLENRIKNLKKMR